MGNTIPSVVDKTALSILQPADAWAQQSRQSVARSHACGLLANGADDDELRASIAAFKDGELEGAVDGWQRENAPLNELPAAMLERVVSDEIGGFVRLTGGGWMPEHRQEFIDQCCVEFALLPAAIVIPAIRLARRKVFDPKRFVSWVFEYIQKDLDRLEAEGKRLGALARIAGI